METNKILELIKKAEDKVNSTMLSNIRKTEINLILLEIQKVAINYSQCCTQLKDDNVISFEDWLKDNRYHKRINGYAKGLVFYYEKELRQKYNEYLQSL